jgi:hypothetical protein
VLRGIGPEVHVARDHAAKGVQVVDPALFPQTLAVTPMPGELAPRLGAAGDRRDPRRDRRSDVRVTMTASAVGTALVR